MMVIDALLPRRYLKTPWMFLVLAICMENTAAAALDSNDGFTRA
ncbi:hypothetical protein [Xanthomonas oryzae]|nr:hypothetical protein [Xanthomonas oryzae]